MRVFIDPNGKFYKGTSPKNPSDMESMHPTADQLTVLDVDEAISREEMIAKIIDLGNKRATAVLAPSETPNA